MIMVEYLVKGLSGGRMTAVERHRDEVGAGDPRDPRAAVCVERSRSQDRCVWLGNVPEQS